MKVPIDKVGLALLVIWVGALQVLLDKGKDLDWFDSGQIVTLAIVAAIGLFAFLVWELTERHPIVDLTLFRNRNFCIATVAMALAYGAFFGNVVLLPLWLQQYMGYTATLAGIVLAPVGIARDSADAARRAAQCAASRSAPDLDDCRPGDSRSSSACARISTPTPQFGTLLLPTLIQGVAMACFFVPLVTLSLSGLAPERIPAASGLFNFARITAGSFGTSIVTTLWDRRATLHHARLVEHLTPGDPVTAQSLLKMQAGGLGSEQGLPLLNRLVDSRHSCCLPTTFSSHPRCCLLVLIGVIWFARPARTSAPPESVTGAH